MLSPELSFSSSDLLYASLQHQHHHLPLRQCKSLAVFCFQKKAQNASHFITNHRKKWAHSYGTKRHKTLSRRIVELIKRHQVDTALQILSDAMQCNYRPDRGVMNCTLAACVHCGDLSSAREIFNLMLEPDNCGVDGTTYGILIKGLGKSRMLDEAYEVVEALESGTAPGGAELSEVHLRSLLNAFAEAGEMMRAHGLLIKYGHILDRTGPSIFTYNVLIKGYARSPNPLEALKVLKDISRLGLQPEKVTFNSLILACVRGGDLAEALRLLREMKEAARQTDTLDLLPDIVTYTMLIQGFGLRGCFDGVVSVVEELRSSDNCPLDRVAYGVIIDAYMQIESPEGLMEGLSILQEMLDLAKENKNLWPKSHVFLSLMRGFASKGDVETVKRLQADMVSLAAGPVTPQHRAEADELLIEAAVNDGQLSLARQLLKEMKALEKGIPLSSRAYLAVIRLDFFSDLSNDAFHPYVLKDGISVDDPVEKWMQPIDESKPPLQNVRLSEVVMHFFQDAIVPIVDALGNCVGVVHREDCFELNASLGSLMRRPPPSLPTRTSIGVALTVLLESKVKMVAVVIQMKGGHEDAKEQLVGFLTLERVLLHTR